MEKLIIGHFYPDLLNLYGDRGNVLALMRRATLRGIEVEVKRISIGDDVKNGDIDIGFIGGGQDSEQNIMADDMKNVKGEVIKQMIDEGVKIEIQIIPAQGCYNVADLLAKAK